VKASGKPLRVLHVEDSSDDSALVMRELTRGGFEPTCERVETQIAFKAALRAKEWDVIISDYSLPSYNGLIALADTHAEGKDIPFILVSGTIGEVRAVNAMQAGAQDYVLKSSLDRLPLAIERELREANGRMVQRKMSERLAISERLASAGVLAAGVAHEINNPLAVVMANLDFIARRLEGPALDVLSDIGEPLLDAREAVECIRAIVRDMKLFARPQDDERSAVDIKSVIESSIRMASSETRHRAMLVREYGDVPKVDSNAARLGQVILNLLVNAAQAMPTGRSNHNEIRVVTKLEGETVVIEVRDNGTGIPKDIVGRIFDPFFTTKPAGIGTGLGLALCHRIVGDLGGTISVESVVSSGTIFRVALPIVSSEPSRRSLPSVSSMRPVRRARVLVIDDQVAICRVLKQGLAPHHEVTTLTNGKDALTRIASGERFDVILTDLVMPEITGMDIYEELSRSAPDQAKRMIFLTGGAFTTHARDFLAKVSNGRIEKPFEMRNILTAIDSVAA
jgi:signal transduction histidine kinase